MKKCKISSIRYIGKMPTFNVEMKSDQHNYSIISSGKKIFSKNSHSVGYARKSYLCGYLKSHFPAEFMASRLSVEYLRKSEKHMKEYRKEVLRMGFKILPPDINEAGLDWKIVDKKTLMETLLVKNIGVKAAQEIIAHRPYSGPDLLYSFARSVGSAVNTRVVEAMCDAGMWGSVKKDKIVEDFEKIRRDAKKGVGGSDLFG